LACDVLDGDVPKKERQHMIDQFQAREIRTLVCTIGAGGVGITLTAAQTVILIDRPWTPGDTIQCEDRLHRIGQKDAVTSLWIQFGGLDQRIDALLQQKQQIIDQVLTGKRATAGNVPSVRALAAEIMASVRSDTPVEEFLAAHGLALPDGSELLEETTESETEQIAPARKRTRRHRPQNGLRKDGQPDQRVKGKVTRQRLDVKLDPEVIAFLRTLKAPNQSAAKEPGYSGFLEDQVRASQAFQQWQKKQ
jgi:superfamily II DNA/RNA helicase